MDILYSTGKKGAEMTEKVLIFGKDAWPYTREARDVLSKSGKTVEYVNVLADPDHLETMLEHSKGVRKVPVIVEKASVTVGFKGNSWGV